MKRISKGKRSWLIRLCRAAIIRQDLDEQLLGKVGPFQWEDGKLTRFLHYDRAGNPMSFGAWTAAVECFPEMRRVASTKLPSGAWVSTVWLGIDHAYEAGPPVIFETMVFRSRHERDDLDSERHHTEAEALSRHAVMVAKWWTRPVEAPAEG